MPLRIIIVGAGIAGLSAGIALRQAGHTVEIYEKSQFANEIGAALIVAPNGARILSRLGFSFSAAKAVKIEKWNVVKGDNLDPMGEVDFSSAEQMFGASVWAIHRVDLHNELRRLAISEKEPGVPVKIHLASEVIGASPEGSIVLKDGSKRTADLVIAADGLHSVLRGVVLEHKATAPKPTRLSAFRFLISTQKLRESSSFASVLERNGPAAMLLADTKEVVKERHMIWYPCRNGEMQNFVGIHPERPNLGDDAEAVKESMLDEFSHFSPGIFDIIRESSHVKCWPLFVHEPLPRWFNGRVVLIGDAAHPMLPFGGQGSNSAMEDGGSLGYLFTGVDDPKSVTDRLQLFERSRKARASRVQILSSVRAGKEKEVEEELRRYADPPGSTVPTNMIERTIHDYSFDIFKKCDEVLKEYMEDENGSVPN